MENSLFENSFVNGMPLSRFTQLITRAVSSSPDLISAWVTAELSDVRVSGGHCFMELIEKDSAGKTVAKLRATIWQTTFVRLRQKFYNSVGKDITNGIKVLIRGSVSHHSLYGLSFTISDIDPSYTMGDLERLRREIFLRLQKEGIADLNKKKQLPQAPQKIAVISAEGAAGWGDFLTHLSENSEKFVFYPVLFPCVMQGDKVSHSIREALETIESTVDFWDAVAIVRGGGATTDLNGFDDYELAKAIATCGLPVIVGIGHDRDRNILDEIAYASIKTPTAVAGFFIDRMRDAYNKVLSEAELLRRISGEIMKGEQERLATISGYMPLIALNNIDRQVTKIEGIQNLLKSLSGHLIELNNSKLTNYRNLISPLVSSITIRNHQKIKDLISRIQTTCSTTIGNANKKINSLETLCMVLDPINTLKRGYSITRINGKSVTDASVLNKGDKLTTTFNNGMVKSVVI